MAALAPTVHTSEAINVPFQRWRGNRSCVQHRFVRKQRAVGPIWNVERQLRHNLISKPAPMDPERKIAEQDCSKPVDLYVGNLRCK
jgi:hypothetical protein